MRLKEGPGVWEVQAPSDATEAWQKRYVAKNYNRLSGIPYYPREEFNRA